MPERRTWNGVERRNREEMDHVWQRIERLEAILTGEGKEEKGGLRADVADIKAGNKANRWMLRATLGALLGQLVLKLFKLI